MSGNSMLEDTGQNLMQDANMGMKPSSADKLPCTNLSQPAQNTGVNGGAQARKLNQEARPAAY